MTMATFWQNAEQPTEHLPGVVEVTLWSGKGKVPSVLLLADKTVSNSAIGKERVARCVKLLCQTLVIR